MLTLHAAQWDCAHDPRMVILLTSAGMKHAWLRIQPYGCRHVDVNSCNLHARLWNLTMALYGRPIM
jgi:hypothetical protein